MTDDPRDRERVESRAEHLLPEERAAGSDDPRAQAAAILAESDLRTEHQNAAPDPVRQRRTSDGTVSGEQTAPAVEAPD